MSHSPRQKGSWANSDGSMQLNAHTDLRRRHAREIAERLIARCQWLDNADRQLVLAIYSDGKRIRDVAELVNVTPRQLRTRVRRLVSRVAGELYQFVAVHHEAWPEGLRSTAEACVFRGLSTRDAARQLGVSYYTVRRHMEFVRAMLHASRAEPCVSSRTERRIASRSSRVA